jgi:hypothetical protein
VRQWFSLEA